MGCAASASATVVKEQPSAKEACLYTGGQGTQTSPGDCQGVIEAVRPASEVRGAAALVSPWKGKRDSATSDSATSDVFSDAGDSAPAMQSQGGAEALPLASCRKHLERQAESFSKSRLVGPSRVRPKAAEVLDFVLTSEEEEDEDEDEKKQQQQQKPGQEMDEGGNVGRRDGDGTPSREQREGFGQLPGVPANFRIFRTTSIDQQSLHS
eukprot:COSAG01_NODE_6860_length_3466_cov_4.514108_3_plen_209_part_00